MVSPPVLQISFPTDGSKLPECSPHLMPFHIGHTGPAPISTYFRVKAVPAPGGFPPPSENQNGSAADLAGDGTTGEGSSAKEGDKVDQDVEMKELEETNPQAVPPPADPQVSTVLSPSPSAPQPPPSNSARFTAAFRGRTVHGLTIDLPEGYGGIVLQSPDTKVDKDDKRKDANGSEKPRRSARRMEVDEEDGLDDIHEDSASVPVRTLELTGTFSSFVLWHPDIPVDDGKDEYVRALTEWTSLAAEVRDPHPRRSVVTLTYHPKDTSNRRLATFTEDPLFASWDT
ncbi:hypothetical protein JAAARDRAFT_76740 [Jaapia argillacea MUCL 33604]|uniref:Uncharacterized protein n=1 Tax=Jaapia argillacea MUCL 33604 TaxID=933084 RepID=A0A067QE70_9AGAM|nr:hypothetical protein JAAARDRAFT_76740 [Jaapia argillacea MUCL 33604]